MPPPAVRAALARVHDEVRARYYGRGLVVPDALEGLKVLDLGSGSGQDSYVLAQLVGPRGSVVGVDATPAQLAVARRHLDWHAERFGFRNVAFLEGDIERLDALDLAAGRFDLIVSSCVINLVADKAAVFRAAHRLLRPGGELYLADVYADRRVPSALLADPVLHGECLAGALYWGDFRRLAMAAGFDDPRLVTDRPLAVNDPEIAARFEGIGFFSATHRLFKLEGLEPQCEDYGQAVRYRGTIDGAAAAFTLDKHHRIETGRLFPVCGNTWKMLAHTRFAPHFGDFDRHSACSRAAAQRCRSTRAAAAQAGLPAVADRGRAPDPAHRRVRAARRRTRRPPGRCRPRGHRDRPSPQASMQAGALMETTADFIPVASDLERQVAERLVAEGRAFTKPLRYDADTDLVLPDFVLTDMGVTTGWPMEVFGRDDVDYRARRAEKGPTTEMSMG